MKSKSTQGKVYLVGAGPGDPGLVTVRARELLERCDVVVYDYLVNPQLRRWASEHCEWVYVGKEPGRHTLPQEEISQLLVDKAAQGKQVVRLKGGDPFVFGRGGEEMTTLIEHGVAFEIVPGVTAALASAAYTEIPLTHRDYSSSLSFLTGHENPQKSDTSVDFRHFAGTEGTLCLYMGVGQAESIAAELLAGGLAPDTPVAIVQWATLPRQRSARCTLGTLAETLKRASIQAPAIIFVGAAAAQGRPTGWFERRPLFGRRIVVTRTRKQAGALTARLADLGADVLEIPLIDVRFEANAEEVEDVLAELASYEWIVFTSRNGVEGFFRQFFNKWRDIRYFGGLKIACIGDGTASAVAEYALEVDLVADESIAEGLGKALIEHESIENQKILLITGNRNREVLGKMLEEAGAIVDRCQVYATRFTDLSSSLEAERFRKEGADALIFTSSSTVESMCSQPDAFALDPTAKRPLFCSFGPITSATLKEKGLPVDLESAEPSIDTLVEVLQKRLDTVQLEKGK